MMELVVEFRDLPERSVLGQSYTQARGFSLVLTPKVSRGKAN